MKHDVSARRRVSRLAGIPTAWATVKQVHGNRVVRVDTPGEAGEADALWTDVTGLPLAVFTADCFAVVLRAPGAVGIAHAGWRGARDRVVSGLRSEMERAGHRPTTAAVGPGIGSCCFEVGEEVMELFPEHQAATSWGTESVDLSGVVGHQLDGLRVWFSALCTHHEAGFFSHRATGTAERQAAVAWLMPRSENE